MKKTNDTLTHIPSAEDNSELLRSYYTDKWEKAHMLFHKKDFPWEVFPPSIAKSLQQLARSCATSANSLPGVAIAVLSSTLGSTILVAPKESWKEPLTFWVADIRDSGEGKTPAMRSLCKVLYEAQDSANHNYDLAIDRWNNEPKDRRGSEPRRPRGYYATDLTLEGIREEISGHGGLICIQNEVSAFLTSQNQYKSKGSDRESWLALHDGDPSRTVRSDKSTTISNARVSIMGGVQPKVWQKIFGSNDDLYIEDGTVFRFLPTYEGTQFHEITKESWSQENRGAWEGMLKNAIAWGDSWSSSVDWQPNILSLDDEARDLFINWGNDLNGSKSELPEIVKGFIPKIIGYALRLTGAIYCMDKFSMGEAPGTILNKTDVEKGIKTASFYLGHIVHAAKMLCNKDIEERNELTSQTIHLAKTLESLEPELDNGKLSIGHIYEKYNETCEIESRIKNPRSMGSALRFYGLTITPGKSHANGKSGVRCLIWDEKTENFIKHVKYVLEVRESSDKADSDMWTLEEPCLECLADDHLTKDIKDIAIDMSIFEKDGSEPLEGHQGLQGHISIAPQAGNEAEVACESF